MTKVRKVKRRKSFKANINRKRLRNKLRKLPDIECQDIKEAWECKKSTRHNLGNMGLGYDPNEVLKIPNVKKEILQEAKLNGLSDSVESENDKGAKFVPLKSHVALNLEADAKAPRERQFKLPNQQVQFVTYLMDKYGDDYKAMARDKKNYYQLTWCQIRAKINSFKGVPEQYAEYLLKKGDIILEDPTPLEETRKRLAEENVKKFCAPKQKKLKPAKPQWIEESIEDIDFDTGDKLVDVTDNIARTTSSRTDENGKKLKLFSDDDDSDNETKHSTKNKRKDKKSKSQPLAIKNVKTGETKPSQIQSPDIETTIKKTNRKSKVIDKLPSSDSDSEEELEDDENEEIGFVDLNDLSDEELSEDDVLDAGEFDCSSDETNT